MKRENKKTCSEQPVSNLIIQLNDIHDEFNVIRKITLFLGSVTPEVAQNYSDDALDGAKFCFDLLNEQFMTSLDNLDNLTSEVKQHATNA